MTYLRNLLIVIFLVMGICCLYDLHELLVAQTNQLAETEQDSRQALTQLILLIANVNGKVNAIDAAEVNIETLAILQRVRFTVDSLGSTAGIVRKAAIAQNKYWADGSIKLNQDLDDLHGLVGTATKQVELLEPILKDANLIASNLSSATAPAVLYPILSNINTTSINMAIASKEVAGMAVDGHKETSLLYGQTVEAFKPKNRWLTVLDMATGGLFKGLELYYLSRNNSVTAVVKPAH
jgi:hypothetical protein